MLDQLLGKLQTLIREDSSQSKWSSYLGLSILAGFATVILGSAQSDRYSPKAIAAGLILSGSSLVLGLLIGFLFAIPKTTKESQADMSTNQSPRKSQASYIPNSNLEDISDWLTKMIIGVGLIQLKEIPGYISTISAYWERSVGYNFQSAYVSAVIVFFVLGGFLIGYLWTRLALIQDFIDQDPRRIIEELGKIARSIDTPDEIRKEATRQIAEVIKSPSSGLAERTAASAELLTISKSSGPIGIRSIAREGLELVSRYEGERLKAYPDPMGIMVIGYGHTLSEAEKTTGIISIKGREVDFNKGLTRQDAIDLLDQDLEPIRMAVDEMVNVAINSNQRDALVSFAFNVGIEALQGSTLLKELNKNNYDSVPEELMKWCKVGGVEMPGLIARRREEVELWRKAP